MSIEKAFLDSLGLRFYRGQNHSLMLSYNEDPLQGPPSLAHLTASEYIDKSYLNQELFKTYFKFTFVRNPWDRMVSFYRYFEYHRFIGFKDFLQKAFPKLQEQRSYFVMPQYEYIFNDIGECEVDFIGRFENLEADFKIVQEKLACPIGNLEHVNKSAANHNWYSRWNLKFIAGQLRNNPEYISNIQLKTNKKSCYTEYYNSETVEIVSEIYKKDVEYFNYKFGY